MKKKIITILMCATLALLISGCVAGEDSGSLTDTNVPNDTSTDASNDTSDDNLNEQTPKIDINSLGYEIVEVDGENVLRINGFDKSIDLTSYKDTQYCGLADKTPGNSKHKSIEEVKDHILNKKWSQEELYQLLLKYKNWEFRLFDVTVFDKIPLLEKLEVADKDDAINFSLLGCSVLMKFKTDESYLVPTVDKDSPSNSQDPWIDIPTKKGFDKALNQDVNYYTTSDEKDVKNGWALSYGEKDGIKTYVRSRKDASTSISYWIERGDNKVFVIETYMDGNNPHRYDYEPVRSSEYPGSVVLYVENEKLDVRYIVRLCNMKLVPSVDWIVDYIEGK